ncbi:20572_t:CDS:2 [Racocetra persica]|uniref:20572_t:CDS:1 n=1 Tax=Racocetra persica TaxID=160502 RepID=A0ACA9KWE6_9GLOM|nr:20572_t:CDS:2 [Racocetra persica]
MAYLIFIGVATFWSCCLLDSVFVGDGGLLVMAFVGDSIY